MKEKNLSLKKKSMKMRIGTTVKKKYDMGCWTISI
jgi:hypothetical protein